ncbi:WD40-repeat-containing domain protein [Lipomyces japonicus]|uniref:WD40-repeat-containing domain protein n=1 Tax=Lipomyces japonicus TaxID=56871 RepID=UPI0034CFCFB6
MDSPSAQLEQEQVSSNIVHPEVAVDCEDTNNHHDHQQASNVVSFGLAPSSKTTVVSTTTTTTTTTTFPPLILHPPKQRVLKSKELSKPDSTYTDVPLDPRQYPLADQPTPQTLRNFTFEMGGKLSVFNETENLEQSILQLEEIICKNDGIPRAKPIAISNPTKTTTTIKSTTTTTATPTPLSKTDWAHAHDKRKRSLSPRSLSLKNAELAGTSNLVNRGIKRQMTSRDRIENVTADPHDPITSPPHPSSDPAPQVSKTVAPSAAVHARNLSNLLPLPSPSLSPVTGALKNASSHSSHDYFSPSSSTPASASSLSSSSSSSSSLSSSSFASSSTYNSESKDFLSDSHFAMMQIPDMIETFDMLPTNVQNYVLYQLLRRCSKKTLSVVASSVIPALRCDFLARLPLELSINVLRYLDIKSLCIAAQVSRTWHHIVDESEFTWKRLLERDGFELEDDEVQQAVREGWGMVGWTRKSRGCPSQKQMAKSPAVPSEFALPSATKSPFNNIYKAIYRRHYLINQNWMSPRSTPKHLSFPGHGRNVVTCLQFDSDKIITGSDDLCINVYDTQDGNLRCRLDGHEGGVWALQYEENTLVSGSTDRTVRVWDIEKGECTHIFYGHTSTVRCLEILMPVQVGTTSDGKPIMEPKEPLIVTGSRDSTLRVWKLPNKNDEKYLPSQPGEDDGPFFLRMLEGHTQSVRAISGHGDTLVSGSYDTFVRVWKISTGECVHRLAGHGAKVYSVVIDPKRQRCISGSMDWLVKVWSLETGSCLYTLEGHTSLVGLLDLSRTSLVSAAADSTLRVWDPESGAFVHKLEGHTGAITCFQHDEYKVISGSDTTLKLWNIKTGKVVKDLLRDLNRVWQVRFDDRRCVAAIQRGSDTYIEVLDFDYDPTQNDNSSGSIEELRAVTPLDDSVPTDPDAIQA